MPVFPFVCILAAYAAFELADWSAFRPALKPTIVVAAVVACARRVRVLRALGPRMSREDTRNLAREWMVHNVPVRTKIVVEPVVPDLWAQDIGNPSPLTTNGNRWIKYPTEQVDDRPEDRRAAAAGETQLVNIEDFERVLTPELVSTFEQQGYCYVVVGSTQRGRAEVEPEVVPRALDYSASSSGARRSRTRLAVLEGQGTGRVQLRLDVRLLPAGLQPPGPGDDDLPPAGRSVRAALTRPYAASRVRADRGRPRPPGPRDRARRVRPRPRASQPDGRRAARPRRIGPRGGLARGARRRRTPRSTRSPPPPAPT